MRKISDSNAQFDITINPFLDEIQIYHPGTKKYTFWYYDDLDEWIIEEFNGKEYQFHFIYHEADGVELSVYLRDGNYDNLPINLDIEI